MKLNCYFVRLIFVITVLLFHVIYCASVPTGSEKTKEPGTENPELKEPTDKVELLEPNKPGDESENHIEKPGGEDEKHTSKKLGEVGDSEETVSSTVTSDDKDFKTETAIDKSKDKLPAPAANEGTEKQEKNTLQTDQPKAQRDDKGMDSKGGGTKATPTSVTKKNATTVVAPSTSKTIAVKQVTSTTLPDTTIQSFVDKDISDEKEKGLGFEDAAEPVDDENKEENNDDGGLAEVVKLKQDETVKSPEKSQIAGDVSTEKKKAEEPPVIFPEQENSHFFAYFITVVVVCVLGYFVLHNKQKIMALIIEGRHNRKRRSHSYRKLENEGSKGAAQPIF